MILLATISVLNTNGAAADAAVDDVTVVFAYDEVVVDCFIKMAVKDGWLDD